MQKNNEKSPKSASSELPFSNQSQVWSRIERRQTHQPVAKFRPKSFIHLPWRCCPETPDCQRFLSCSLVISDG